MVSIAGLQHLEAFLQQQLDGQTGDPEPGVSYRREVAAYRARYGVQV